MQKQVFRHYDIRGKVGSEFIIDQVYAVIMAFITYAKKQHGGVSRIVVGRDARVHSQEIATQVMHAALSVGVPVYDLGMVTTPVNVYAQYLYDADMGIMITASHNPSDYNGLKLYLGHKAVEADELQAIYELYAQQNYAFLAAHRQSVDACAINDVYIHDMAQQFLVLQKKSMPFVFDAGAGAISQLLPQFAAHMQWIDSTMVCTSLLTPLHEADPTKYKNIAHAIEYATLHNLQGVIAFDGDADRVVAATAAGNIFSGDDLLAVFAQYGTVPGDKVVADIKTSSVVARCVADAQVLYAPTGAQAVMQRMHESGARLGGEVSGHYFFADRHRGYDDGLYAALRLLEILDRHSITLQALYDALPTRFTSPEYRFGVTEQQKHAILQAMQLWASSNEQFETICVDGVRFCDASGWALCRGSNTENLVCIRFEGVDQISYEKFKNIIVAILQPYGLHENIK